VEPVILAPCCRWSGPRRLDAFCCWCGKNAFRVHERRDSTASHTIAAIPSGMPTLMRGPTALANRGDVVHPFACEPFNPPRSIAEALEAKSIPGWNRKRTAMVVRDRITDDPRSRKLSLCSCPSARTVNDVDTMPNQERIEGQLLLAGFRRSGGGLPPHRARSSMVGNRSSKGDVGAVRRGTASRRAAFMRPFTPGLHDHLGRAAQVPLKRARCRLDSGPGTQRAAPWRQTPLAGRPTVRPPTG